MGELEEIKELLQATLSSVNSNLNTHQQMITQLQKENQELKHMLMDKSQNKKDVLKTEILSKFKRNKKRLIKNKILETIKFKQVSVPEIKEIIVDLNQYCSKASFYRYIEELRQKDFIHINSSNIAKIKPLVEVV